MKNDSKKIAKDVIELEIKGLKKLKKIINSSFNKRISGLLSSGIWSIVTTLSICLLLNVKGIDKDNFILF